MNQPTMTTLPGNTSLPSSQEALKALIDADKGTYKYSVEDFFKNPEKTGYQLSPDGNYFSFLAPFERRMNIFIQKIGATTATQITHETDRNIGGYFWKGNNRIVYVKDSGGDENFKLFAVDKDGQNTKDLTPFDKIKIELIDNLKDQDEAIICLLYTSPSPRD